MAIFTSVPTKLLEYRTRMDLALRPTKHLKETFTDFDGQEKPLSLRYYQVQGVLHLVAMHRFLLGDDTGLGKTLESIAALCFIWEKAPDTKVMVLTTKSASKQWAKEFAKFTRGVRVFLCTGTKDQREAVQRAWRNSTGPTVMIMGYAAARRDFTQLQEDAGYIAIFDEATAFKNVKTQVWQACHHFSHQASRVWGLTATLIKNHLMEGHGIYSVVVPGLFGTTNNFMYYFCIVEMMMVGRGRKVPRIVGYYPEKVAEFREKIAPYFLGRPKHDVASELPTLIRQIVEVGMTNYQATKYREALSNLLVINEGKEDEEEKETTKLTAIGYCQEIVDHLELIGCEGASEKLDSLLEMLTDGDLAGEKVIIFSRFKKMINVLMPALKAAGVKAVRITGDETKVEDRQAAMDAFQDPTSDTTVICITMAGSDAINLQAAKAIVFYDSPWSAGDYIQILGRMIRIGSKHASVHAIHLVSQWDSGETVDQRIMEVLGKKMTLVEAVIGERIKGMSSNGNGATIEVRSEVNEIFAALKSDAALLKTQPKAVE